MASRSKVLGAFITVSVAAAFAAGWGLAQRFESPAQREAAARPPAPQPLFAQVTTGSLVDKAEALGVIESANHTRVLANAPAATAVVTAVHLRPGDRVDDGTSLLSVNGYRVLVFASPFSFYRDLSSGLTGPDVGQLQQALRRTGAVIPVSEDQTFGPATASALRPLLAGDSSAGSDPAAVTLRLAQISTVPSLPAVVAKIAAVGTAVSVGTELAVLDSGPLLVRAPFASGAGAVLTKGMPGEIVLDGKPIALTVDRVAGGVQADAGGTVEVVLRSVTALTEGQRRKSGIVTVTIETVTGPAFLVPTRAVAASRGGSQVLRRTATGFESVSVTVLGTLAGSSAVKPDGTARLSNDDFVKVG